MLVEILYSRTDGFSQENTDNLSAITFNLPPPYSRASKAVELVDGAAAELLRTNRPGRKANRSAITAAGMIVAAEQRLCTNGYWDTSNPDASLAELRNAATHAQRFVRRGLPARFLTVIAGWADIARGLAEVRS